MGVEFDLVKTFHLKNWTQTNFAIKKRQMKMNLIFFFIIPGRKHFLGEIKAFYLTAEMLSLS